MNLLTRCKSCKKDIKVKSSAATRADLQMEKGDEFQVNCQKCGKVEIKHINDIKAEPNKIILLAGFVIGVLVTIVLFIYYGLIGTISIIIPMIFWQQQQIATKSFNAYMVRRK
jgi:hypothetical protein